MCQFFVESVNASNQVLGRGLTIVQSLRRLPICSECSRHFARLDDSMSSIADHADRLPCSRIEKLVGRKGLWFEALHSLETRTEQDVQSVDVC